MKNKLEKIDSKLTERELEIAKLVSLGYSNKEIADKSGITVGTTKVHVRKILVKLNVSSRVKIALYCLRNQITLLSEI